MFTQPHPFLFTEASRLASREPTLGSESGGKGASQAAQWVKNLPAMPEVQETWAQSLGWEDPLEEEMATHSSTLARIISWTEEPVGHSPRGCKESDMTERQGD